MRKPLLVAFIIIAFATQTTAQDSTVYKNLKVRKEYAVSLYSYESDSGESIYEVNGKQVSKSTFRKYDRGSDDIDKCCPCILRSFDENDALVREGVQCSDCGVGWFKEYYPDGLLKRSGRYKENISGNWDLNGEENEFPCSVPQGRWDYFNESGSFVYSEYWNDGQFLAQVPPQDKTEIWKVDATLNGITITGQTFSADQLKDIIIAPRYKNSSTDGINLSIQFNASTQQRKYFNRTTTIDSFKQFDWNASLIENGFKSGDDISYRITVINNEDAIASFYPIILTDLPADTAKSIASEHYMWDLHVPEFYLVNSMDTAKKVRLAHKLAYTLTYEEPATDTLIQYKTVDLQGYINGLSENSLSYDILTEDIRVKWKNGLESHTETDYWNCDNDNFSHFREVDLRHLTSLKYTNPTRELIGNLGNVTLGFSTLTALFVAPLVSINYKSWEFNKNRYFKVAGSGLIGIAVGIPLMTIGQPKEYTLTNKWGEKNWDYWYISEEAKK
jgi:hypothetical protein